MTHSPRVRSGAAAGVMAVVRILGRTLDALIAVLSFRLAGIASIAAASAPGIAGLPVSIPIHRWSP